MKLGKNISYSFSARYWKQVARQTSDQIYWRINRAFSTARLSPNLISILILLNITLPIRERYEFR